MLDLVSTLGEENVRLAVLVLDEDQHSGRSRFGMIEVAWVIFRKQLGDALDDLRDSHD